MLQDGATQNRRHACDRCRKAKIRCLVDTVKEYGKCRRCFDNDEDCIFERMAPRTRRQRTDTRLAALEQQLRILKAAYDKTHPSSGGVCPATETSRRSPSENESVDPTQKVLDGSAGPGVNDQLVQETPPQKTPSAAIRTAESTTYDLVIANRLSIEDASDLYNMFVVSTLPQFPVTVIDDSENFESLRASKPTLLAAMIVAACRARHPVLFRELHFHLQKILTEKAVLNGEKNLELVMSILIMEVWIVFRNDMQHLNFYMWLQIAYTVALQLGLFWPKNTASNDDQRSSADGSKQLSHRWRVALAVYLSISSVSISLRLPKAIEFVPKAHEALAMTAGDPKNASDIAFVAWIKLQLIAEQVESLRVEIGQRPTTITELASFSPKLNNLDEELALFERWVFTALNGSLLIQYHYIRCKLYEVAILLHEQKPIHQCQLQATVTSRDHHNLHQSSDTSEKYRHALVNLIRSCQAVLDSLFNTRVSVYLDCPTTTTMRVLYAARVLYCLDLFLYRSAADESSYPGRDFLRLDLYIQQLEAFMTQAQGSLNCEVPRLAGEAVRKLQEQVASGRVNKLHKSVIQIRKGTERAKHTGDEPRDDFEIVTTPDLRSDGSAIPRTNSKQQAHTKMTPDNGDEATATRFQNVYSEHKGDFPDQLMSQTDFSIDWTGINSWPPANTITPSITSLWDVSEAFTLGLNDQGWFDTAGDFILPS